MKILAKSLSFLMAVAILLSFWSCRKEEVVVPENTDDVALMVSIADVQTKAVADGSNVDVLYYEVYGTDVETAAAPIYEGSLQDRSAEGKFFLNITLVKDVEYHFVFWAQVDGENHYDVTDLRKVGIVNYDDEDANDESRAAFYAYEKIRVTGQADKNITVTLRRPFSQINFGTTTYASSGSPLVMNSSKMVVDRIADTFNTLTGEGEGENIVTFDYAATPNGAADMTDKLLETNGTEYYWLGMNYVIVCGSHDSVTVDAYFSTNMGDAHLNVPNVRIERNHRTNIVGNLLITNAVFNIVVDEDFLTPDEDRDDKGNKLNI